MQESLKEQEAMTSRAKVALALFLVLLAASPWWDEPKAVYIFVLGAFLGVTASKRKG